MRRWAIIPVSFGGVFGRLEMPLPVRWRIGDGRNIRIMNEPWLRGTRECCLMGPQNQGVYTLTINDLLLPNVKQWNMGVLRDLFDYSMVRDILQVPLSEEVIEDRMIWKDDLCGHNYEDDWHVFVGCSETFSCWQSAGLNDIISPRLHSFQDLKSFIFDICLKDDRYTVGRVAVMLEGLWKNRNDFVWHNEKEDASKLGWLAFHKWQDWFMAQNIRAPQLDNGEVASWNPPPIGSFKCNVDAAFNKRVGTTNRGWCMRNDHGNFVAAGTAWDGSNFSVLEAEALALKEAIHSVIMFHNAPTIFESDSQQVVQALRSNKPGSSEFFSIINSIKLLLLDFPYFEEKSAPTTIKDWSRLSSSTTVYAQLAEMSDQVEKARSRHSNLSALESSEKIQSSAKATHNDAVTRPSKDK
ncbi:uncharacterized protein LOC131650213 [Vicia villosa]|uniref:uncharacterized protein LOC131650213 n=1 Tax=Vicia villosa TaxID=3911 RepID=UPI00273CAB18|nr:uncharacterized protein LOC131650213 [Vicia villosa]